MASYRAIKGLSVVALAEGKKVGQIEDLIVDPEARAVRWLRLGGASGALFGAGPSSWVPASAVRSVGEHAVTINGQADVRESEDVPEAVELVKGGRALLGKKVISEDGTFMGEARDFTFDPSDFRLTSLIVAQGNNLSPQKAEISANQLVTIGEDLVIVRAGAQANESLDDGLDGEQDLAGDAPTYETGARDAGSVRAYHGDGEPQAQYEPRREGYDPNQGPHEPRREGYDRNRDAGYPPQEGDGPRYTGPARGG